MTAVRTRPRISELPPAPGVSFNQEQICLLEAFYPRNKAYNAQAEIRVRGALDLSTLERAVSHVVERHEMLRTTISLGATGYLATVHPPFPFTIRRHDLTGLPDGEAERELAAIRSRLQDQVFDTTVLPLLTLDAVRLAADEWALLQVEHHAVHDGWSFGRLWAEIQDCYDALAGGRAPELAALPAQYQQFVRWQRDRMAGEYGERAVEFWSDYLDGAGEVVLGGEPTGADSLDGHNLELTVTAETFARVRERAGELAVSPFVVMFSAYALLLAGKTGATDFCVGTAVNARTEAELEPLVGMVVNTVPVRVAVGAGEGLPGVARGVQGSLFRALRYNDVPLSLIVRRLGLAQRRGRNPVFQHCFSFHDSDVPRLRFGGATAEIREAQNQSAKFDMNVVVIPPSPTRDTGHARMFWQFSRAVFSRAEAVALAAEYERLLVRVLHEP
ncbi:condensation domain-containing protein [Actinokineospora cianjurensis]|uniref:Condensation domain-containing protein n=1 Tax=Actinokineospora cianjurensis TaxID=585224 RepID=A0A421B385_9PSEU|nr:condensation domain-containing protein [Actinokineospora cianjurensis]RLK58750.1 condensation domain-containing protein [Actinokineospora cianjurensis]